MAGFKHNTLHSIAGDPLLKYARGKDHFLFRLDKAIDWGEVTPKMLLLAYLLNVSERSLEEQCRWYIPARLFVGLGIYDAVPDHATLTLFKQRLQRHGGTGGFTAPF